MGVTNLFFLLLFVISGVVSDCSEAERNRTQVEFDTCYVSSMEIEDECERIETVIQVCCDLWSECHDDVGSLRDRLIVELVERDHDQVVDGGLYDSCSVVMEFRQSGRIVTNHQEHCSRDQLTRTMSLFRNCSEPNFAAVFNLFYNLEEIEDHGMIVLQICQTLQNIETRCTEILKECYSDQDLQHTKETELTYFKEYLMGLFNDRVNISGVSDCDAVVGEDYPDYGGYSYEYMSSTEVSTFTSDETGNDLSDLLSTVTEKILNAGAGDNTSKDAVDRARQEGEDIKARTQTNTQLESNVKRLLNETKEAVDSTESNTISSEEDATFDSIEEEDQEYAMDSSSFDLDATDSVEIDLEMNRSEKKSGDLSQREERKPRNESNQMLGEGANYKYLITTLALALFIMVR